MDIKFKPHLLQEILKYLYLFIKVVDLPHHTAPLVAAVHDLVFDGAEKDVWTNEASRLSLTFDLE